MNESERVATMYNNGHTLINILLAMGNTRYCYLKVTKKKITSNAFWVNEL